MKLLLMYINALENRVVMRIEHMIREDDISTNSAHYVYRKSIGTVKEKISILILGFKGLIDRLPWSFQLLTGTSEGKSVN